MVWVLFFFLLNLHFIHRFTETEYLPGYGQQGQQASSHSTSTLTIPDLHGKPSRVVSRLSLNSRGKSTPLVAVQKPQCHTKRLHWESAPSPKFHVKEPLSTYTLHLFGREGSGRNLITPHNYLKAGRGEARGQEEIFSTVLAGRGQEKDSLKLRWEIQIRDYKKCFHCFGGQAWE